MLLLGIKLLHDLSIFTCDGTFDKCPSKFSQIYSIHGVHSELPERAESSLVAYGLMCGRSTQHYRIFFDTLSQKVHEEFGDQGSKKV
jgi:hypothetical protein